ncbi:MAG: toll/interleukin-1 receptor domain-containing protein [Bryobacteraceae bacterium]
MIRGAGSKALIKLIQRCLLEGSSIEIDGLGSFDLDTSQRVVFRPNGRIRVFLAYAEEDRALVRKLCGALQRAGFEPWMDKQKLLPGQNWPRAIERAIEISDFFIGCFSSRSVLKRGYFQSELRYALETASRVPLEDSFILPVRLGECELPRQIAKTLHYVDLFPDWDRGIETLVSTMWRQKMLRSQDREPAA